MGACNTLAIAITIAETIRALRDAGVADVDRHPAVVGMTGQLAYLTGQSLGPPSETLTLIDHFGTMRQDAS
jgi:predicted amino acid dehydrogenase